MPTFNATRLLTLSQSVISPSVGGYDIAETPLEDIYDVDGDYDDISLYVTRAEGYRDE